MSVEVQNVIVAILVGVTIWLIKQFLQSTFESRTSIIYGNLIELTKRVADHIEECNDMPKSLIIEKIENLTKTIEHHAEESKEFRDEVRKELGFQRQRYHDLNNTMMKLAHNKKDD